MIFCSNCFCDEEVKAIIIGKSEIGDCEICNSKQVSIYNTEKMYENEILVNMFEELVQIFTPSNLLPEKYPKGGIGLLKDELQNNWHIFNELNGSDIYRIITTLCSDLYDEQPDIFDNPIGILEMYDDVYLNTHSLLKNKSWVDFTYNLKHINRFHTNDLNLDILEKYCSFIRKHYSEGAVFYRGRISERCGFQLNEMGAPDKKYATAGRANCEGISNLYLADCAETTIREVRAGAFDYVSVGQFKLLKDIIVVNLKDIDKISPFKEGLDKLEYAVNRETLKRLNKELGKALRRSDSNLDYIPTQYISDFIKRLCIEDKFGGRYAGVEYNSTMNPDGFNLSIYYPELFECINRDVYNIVEFNPKHKKI